MTSPESTDSPEPELEVIDYVAIGLDMAEDSLSRLAPDENKDFLLSAALQLLQKRFSVVVDTRTIALPPGIDDETPPYGRQAWAQMLIETPADPQAWSFNLRFAVELILAQEASVAFEQYLDRYPKLSALQVERALPSQVRPYIRELHSAYLHGQDIACIALACASMEQIGKHALAATGQMTAHALERERLTADGVVQRLSQAGLISKSRAGAQRLAARRNSVLHRGAYDSSVLPQLALDAIREFQDLCVELSPSWPDE